MHEKYGLFLQNSRIKKVFTTVIDKNIKIVILLTQIVTILNFTQNSYNLIKISPILRSFVYFSEKNLYCKSTPITDFS